MAKVPPFSTATVAAMLCVDFPREEVFEGHLGFQGRGPSHCLPSQPTPDAISNMIHAVAVALSSAALPSAAAMQAAALPSAAAIRVGDIVIGRATQYKEKFNAVKGKVIAIQAQHYEVHMLEGPAQCEFHKYLHHLVTGVKPDGTLPQAAPAGAVDAQDFAAALRKRQTLSLAYFI